MSSTNFTYTGVGSREIPHDMFVRMMMFGYMACKDGATLRSGKATGSDTAFQLGHEMYLRQHPSEDKRMEIYTVNDRPDYRTYLTSACDIEGRDTPAFKTFCIKKCREIHPAGKKLKGKALQLHARNILQVVGQYCNEPSDMCVYFAREDQYGVLTGGTATAAHYVAEIGVPYYNILLDKGDDRVRQLWNAYTNPAAASDELRSAIKWAYQIGDSDIKERIRVGADLLNLFE